MSEIKNPLEIYKALPRTNCGQCGLPSCMAFAASVFQRIKSMQDCPLLDPAVVAHVSPRIGDRRSLDDEHMEVIQRLQQQVRLLDFTEVAPRIGATLINEKLVISALGKNFIVNQEGQMTSTCHINHWLYVPILHYILECVGRKPGGDWVSFAELAGTSEWSQYFTHRCEEALRQLADSHRELVFEMFNLFGAQPLPTVGGADHSLLIMPLPMVPFLINYWQPEDNFPSQLNILFDRSAEQNINPHSITLLARGIIEMFRQLIVSHSRDGKLFC